jgi:predicted small metal-binding protein
MAKEDLSKHANDKGANPFDNPAGGRDAGTVNPSGPTTGTEGFGLGPGEASTTGVGQGTLGSKGRGGSLETPAARADSAGAGDLHFRCADIHAGCNWQTSGRNEQELRRDIEQHGRERHNMKDWTEDMWNRVRNTFRRTAA